jgi:Domain of unknown function (DUF4919)
MNSSRMFVRSLILLLALATWAAGQESAPKPTAAPTPTPSPAPKSSYDSLLERVKQGDKTADFKELRFAFTETPAYSPYGGDRDLRKEMFVAINGKDYDKALASAERMLAKNYLDINGHFGCFAAHNRLGHTDKAAYHKFVFEGLLNSIKDSGDGKTPETAFIVISTDEEYALFNWLGLRVSGQALIHKDGHDYDKMTVNDPKTNETSDYFFNIDKPFTWLGNSLKK